MSSARVITRDGDPWFVLADVCQPLEIGNPSQAATCLDDDEKHTPHYW
jgi:anti-repressor protein